MSDTIFTYNSRIPVLNGRVPYRPGGAALDPDAEAFLTATSITDATISTAINDFVVGLKTDNLWTEFLALYPMVGGTADTHKYNLMDPRDLDAAFRITWNGTVTHNSNGVQGNGSTGYGNTYINDTNNLDNFGAFDNKGFSIYSRTNSAITAKSYGADDTTNLSHAYIKFTDNNTYFRTGIGNGDFSPGVSNTQGLFTFTRISSIRYVYQNGSLFGNSSVSGIRTVNRNYYILAGNNNNTAGGFSNRNYTLFAFHKGFDATKSSNFYTRVQALQTALSRQV